MTTLGLWAIICSAVLVAQLINVCLSMVITSTKWYRKLITRVTVGMAKDLDFVDDETEEGKKILDYIKEDY